MQIYLDTVNLNEIREAASWGVLSGVDGMDLIREVVAIYRNDPAIKTMVLAASIRHPRHIIDAAIAGADIATCPFKVLQQSMKHPLTDKSIEQFLADWKARSTAA